MSRHDIVLSIPANRSKQAKYRPPGLPMLEIRAGNLGQLWSNAVLEYFGERSQSDIRCRSGGERRQAMRRLSPNPDRDFSAGYQKRNPEIDQLLAEPPLPWDDILDDPVIRERVGKLICNAMRRTLDLH
jgi:hypothetical protein